jgi:uncharacterized protein YdhG (YjbR/CyaY superfamily)
VGEQFATVDEYIASCPDNVQPALEQMRRAIRDAAPTAHETISYHMPTFTLDGSRLVYFAAWKHHLALYAIPRLGGDLERELAPYRAVKNTLKFPLDEALPHDLIRRLTVVLVQLRQRDSG